MKRVTEKYLEILRKDLRNDAYLKLLFEFYITFSRFEFTLKKMGYLQKNNRDEAEPNWNDFSKRIMEQFEKKLNAAETDANLTVAVENILLNPPKKQYRDLNNNIEFKSALDNSKSETKRLSTYIRRIRNNLFHGAKDMAIYGDTSRDRELIISALVVLSFWITIDPEFESVYFEA